MSTFKRGDRKVSSWGPVVSVLGDKHFGRKVVKNNPNLKGRYTPQEWRKIRDDFFELVGDIMIEQPNGVVLDGLGYFCFPAYNKRVKVPLTDRTTFQSGGLVYYTQFFGRVFINAFFYGLSFELTRKQKKKWRDCCTDGAKYFCHYKNIKNIIGNGTKRLHPTRTVHS